MDVQTVAEYRQGRSVISYKDKSDLDRSDTGDSLPYKSASPSLEMVKKWLNAQTALRASMIEGYRTMAAENLKLAEENISIVFETWPQWE